MLKKYRTKKNKFLRRKHIDNLDQIVVKLNVLKSGKVRVKVSPQMAILNEKYYSKYKTTTDKEYNKCIESTWIFTRVYGFHDGKIQET